MTERKPINIMDKKIHPEIHDYIDLINGVDDKPPYRWTCPKCKQLHIFRRADSFTCGCGQTLRFRFRYEG